MFDSKLCTSSLRDNAFNLYLTSLVPLRSEMSVFQGELTKNGSKQLCKAITCVR